jgi:hypothetical protein
MKLEINIVLSKSGKLTYPERTVVKSEDEIVWNCHPEGQERTRWTIYFHHGSPFAKEAGHPDRFEATQIGRTTALGPFIAYDPGDYKYGVRADDPVTGSRLAATTLI